MKTKFLLINLLIAAFLGGGCSNNDSEGSTTEVTSISLNSNTLSLTVASSSTLTATILPSTSTSAVTWTSSSTDIATVSDGTITGVADGTATITAKAGTKTATCIVTVTASSSSGSNYSQSSGNNSVSTQTYTSNTSDQNAVKVSGGSFTMTNCTINKSGGDTSNSDNSSFYGINAAVLATTSGTVTMNGGTITTNAIGANGVVAYNGTVNISDVAITCSKNLSRGIHATGGGNIIANNLTVTTAGSNSSVIATDKGGGTVTVTNGTYTTTGTDCAVLYSTGTITANTISGSSSQGEVGVIEGSNTININNCTMSSGSSNRGLMILQSGSGDASGYDGAINVTGGSITLTGSSTPLIEITTSTTGTVTLKDVTLNIPSNILMKVDYNTRWSTTSPVAYLVLNGTSGKTYTGNVVVDKYGTSTVTVASGITWNGTYDNGGTGKTTNVIVNGTWTLTGNSNVKNVTIASGGVINKNGYTLTVSGNTSNSGTINN